MSLLDALLAAVTNGNIPEMEYLKQNYFHDKLLAARTKVLNEYKNKCGRKLTERERDERVNKEEGTGLGMAITNNIVKMMNGQIEVESELGKGSTFTVLVSLKQLHKHSEEDKQEEKETDEVNIEGKHVLLVEDIEVNREIAREILEMLGLQVEMAVDGKDALEQFKASKKGAFDLILMDVQMPVMNGYESTRAIRGLEREDAKEIPIIAMTANAFMEDVQDAKRAGMNDHLAKPINVGKLMEMFQKWLGERS